MFITQGILNREFDIYFIDMAIVPSWAEQLLIPYWVRIVDVNVAIKDSKASKAWIYMYLGARSMIQTPDPGLADPYIGNPQEGITASAM